MTYLEVINEFSHCHLSLQLKPVPQRELCVVVLQQDTAAQYK